MSLLRNRTLFLVAACATFMFLYGCSSPNSQSFIDPDTGKHAANWLPSSHAMAASSGTTSLGTAVPNTAACTQCHGADLDGGISGVSCTGCHLGGPTSVHPATWVPVPLTHGPSVSSGSTPVAKCSNQYCHGTSLGGVAGSGPSCSTCHAWPFTPGSVVCGSCHGIPPSGSVYPDTPGRHALHTAWTGTATASCSACHNGSDGASGTVTHSNGVVEVSILSTYNSKSGSASYDSSSMSCSQVSCHGGPRTQTATQANALPSQATLAPTPSWSNGTIDVGTQCTSCHVYGTLENNSYNSGQHFLHVWDPNNGPAPNGQNPKVACTVCHDSIKLAASHFTTLNTPALEGPASATILDSLQYNSPSLGNCSPPCHDTTSW